MRLFPALALLVPALAAAQGEARRPTFEVMPAIGYGVGGSFENSATGEKVDIDDGRALALSLRMHRGGDQEWEILYSRQDTDIEAGSTTGGTPRVALDVEYLQFGGSYFPTRRDYAPYLVGGLGMTRFKPAGAGLGDTTDFSLSLGAGMRFPIGGHLALRLEGRGFLTFVDADTAFFCSSGAGGGACLIRSSGSTVLQFQALLGISAAF